MLRKLSRSSSRLRLFFLGFAVIQLLVGLVFLRNSSSKVFLPFYSWSHFSYAEGDPCVWQYDEVRINSVNGQSLEASGQADRLKLLMDRRVYIVVQWAQALRKGYEPVAANQLKRYSAEVFAGLQSADLDVVQVTENFKDKSRELTVLRNYKWRADGN